MNEKYVLNWLVFDVIAATSCRDYPLTSSALTVDPAYK